MKLIKYNLSSGEVTIECKTEDDFNANYPIAEKEAIGEIIVEGEFEPEQDNATTDDILNVMLGVNV